MIRSPSPAGERVERMHARGRPAVSTVIGQAGSGCPAGPMVRRVITRRRPAGVMTHGFVSPTFGTTIRISRLRYPSCLSRRARDLRFLRTVGDRW